MVARKWKGRRARWLATVFGCTISASFPAGAQTAVGVGQEAVASRARPEYDAIGIDLGGFKLSPSLQTSFAYDDDLYATAASKVSAEYLDLRPVLGVQSQWSRHSLQITATGDIRRYVDRASENNDQYSVKAVGRIDVSHDTRIDIDASQARVMEPRGEDGDTLVGLPPVMFDQTVADLRVTQAVGRFTLQAAGSFSQFLYNDREIGGIPVDLSYRNYRSITYTGRVAYSVGPGLALFVVADGNANTYLNPPAGADRNSSGYDILTGVSFGLTPLLSGEVGVGYIKQDFDSAIFSGISGLDYNASLAWNPTPLISVTGSLAKSVQRGPLIGIAGIEQTTGTLVVDYEVLRNLLAEANLGYSVSSYKGLNLDSYRLSGSLLIRYLVNRNLSFSLSGGQSRQRPGNSTSQGRGYDRNQAAMGVTIKM